MRLIDKDKLIYLASGTAGIYSIYFVSSVIQEYIMKVPYENRITQQMQTFQNSNSFILIPSVCSWIVGAIYNKLKPNQKITEIPKFNLIICSLIILVSALAMTKAIYLTNFPLVILFKSCNILSVIIVALACSRVEEESQKLNCTKLLIGIFFTAGIISYHFGSATQRFQFQGSALGVFLLLFSVVLDGFLPDFQAEIKTKYKPTAMQMFLQTNKWKTILSFIYSVATLEILYLFKFFSEHPKCFMHMMVLGFTGSLGQIVVYWMISHFKQHVVPFVITTRKLFTVIISIVYFKHESTLQQNISLGILFLIVLYDFYNQIASKQKVKLCQNRVTVQEEETKILDTSQQHTHHIQPQNQQNQPLEANTQKS